VVLLAAAVPSAAAADSPPLPEFGSQFHATWTDYTSEQRELVLERLQRAGVEWVRIDVGWETLEPRRSGAIQSWYRDLLDHAVDRRVVRACRSSSRWLATPRWASGRRSATAPPRDPDDFGAVMGWLAHRYEGEVDAYEVWNEPNSPAFFSGSPRDYAEMLRSAHDAIAEADPDAMVVAGATQYNDDAFLEAVYEAGGQGLFDVWSTHPYMGLADAPPETEDDGTMWTMDHVRVIRAVMDEHEDRDVPIWFTEFGWSSHSSSRHTPEWRRGVSTSRQASYLVRALRFVAAEHPSVEVMIWYTERNKDTGDRHEDNYGLLTRDLRPKPVYLAARRLLK